MSRERSGHPAIVFCVAVIATLAILFATNWSKHQTSDAGSRPASLTPSPTSTASTQPTDGKTPSATKSTAPPLTHAQLVSRATAECKSLDAGLAAGSVSVAALNTVTGAKFSWGATSGMWTASVYKLFVLETLLLHNGGPLSGTEASEAIPMIENSDNVAGYSEFLAAGGRPGLVAAVPRLGLKHTVPGNSDPTFTTTSATDMITLLGNLVHSGPLTSAARSYALNLMRQVEADQRWGVGVVADKGTDFANKNGWLGIDNTNGPGEDDNGLWAVNSIGVVTIHGQQVLMAVMTRHRPDFQSGVNLVQALARAIAPVVSSAVSE
jgi:hypothetical protein